MSNSSKVIFNFEKRSAFMVVFLSCLKGLLKAFPILIMGFLIFSGLDHWVSLPVWARKITWALISIFSAGVFISGFFPLSKYSIKEKSNNFFKQGKFAKNVRLRKDEIRLALDLSRQNQRPGISFELQELYLEKVAAIISKASASWCFPPWNWKKGISTALISLMVASSVWGFFGAQFPLGQRVLFPFGSVDLTNLITVTPGDAFVPWGGDVEVRIASRISSLHKPALYVKTEKEWFRVDSQKDKEKLQIYFFENVVEPLQYRVKLKNDWGQKYTITPRAPFRLTEFKISIKQPDYVGGTVVKQSSPELSGLPGSQINLEAQSNLEIKTSRVLFSDGTEREAIVKKGQSIQVQFSLFASGTYSFVVKTPNDVELILPDKYPIHVLDDSPPTLALLSPDADLVIGPQEILPITFDARDDFGLKKSQLIWERQDGKRRIQKINSYPNQKESVLETYEWDLGKNNFRPGEIIRYKVEVVDGNVVTGPGVASSEWKILEIASFEKGHEAVEEALESWRDEVLELLAEVNTLKTKADIEQPNIDELIKEFNQTASKSSNLENVLEKIVSAMEEDPLSDYGVWLEHKAMEENFEMMNKSSVKRTQSALQTRNPEQASKGMEQMSAELERMLALSEELSKNQRARDVLDSGDQLSNVGEDLLKQLEAAAESGKPIDKAQMEEVQKLLNEAQKLLSEMAKSLEKFPDELPEDFVNQEALKNLEMDKSQDILSQIADALKKGDAKKALELAKQFLEMAKKMSDNLSEAHESYLQENSAEELESKIQEQQEELERVTNEQREILAETQKLESKRLEAVLKEQEKLLKELAKRQKEVNENINQIMKNKNLDTKPRQIISTQLKNLRDTLAELESGRVENSPKWLGSIIENLKTSAKEAEAVQKSVSLAGSIRKEKDEEVDILKKLQEEIQPKGVFSQSDKKSFSELNQRQKELSKKTDHLRKNLQRLSQKTASLGIPLTQSLSGAKSKMDQASNELGNQSSQKAQRLEEGALRDLQNAQQSLQQAQDAMNQMAAQQKEGGGGGGGQPRVMMRGKQSGSRGQKVGKVRLPTAEDYKPPKEFREELLESLKEKFPEIYEDIIHKYFKRLSE